VTAMFALSAIESNNLPFFVAYVPIVLFWFLDSYYLQLERKYRVLYNKVRAKAPNEIDFNLGVGESKREDKTRFFQSLMSRTEFGFYFPIAALVAVVAVITDSQLMIK